VYCYEVLGFHSLLSDTNMIEQHDTHILPQLEKKKKETVFTPFLSVNSVCLCFLDWFNGGKRNRSFFIYYLYKRSLSLLLQQL